MTGEGHTAFWDRVPLTPTFARPLRPPELPLPGIRAAIRFLPSPGHGLVL